MYGSFVLRGGQQRRFKVVKTDKCFGVTGVNEVVRTEEWMIEG